MSTIPSSVASTRHLHPWRDRGPGIKPPVEDGQIAVTTAGMSLAEARVRVRYRLIGRSGAPVLLTLDGISADRCMDQWWGDLLGSGCAFDPECFRILGMDWLSRDDGHAIRTSDQALALVRLLDELGIEKLECCIGASYGAMVGLALAAGFPQRIGRLVAISGPHRAHPMTSARRLVQREILRLAAERDVPERGVALARALALTTYRPPVLFEQRFDQPCAQQRLSELRGYLRHVGVSFAGHFDQARYLSLSESMDLHQVDPGQVRCETHLVAVDSDELVPQAQLECLAGQLAGPKRLHLVRSVFGHDAFLKEPEVFNRLIRCIVEKEECHALV